MPNEIPPIVPAAATARDLNPAVESPLGAGVEPSATVGPEPEVIVDVGLEPAIIVDDFDPAPAIIVDDFGPEPAIIVDDFGPEPAIIVDDPGRSGMTPTDVQIAAMGGGLDIDGPGGVARVAAHPQPLAAPAIHYSPASASERAAASKLDELGDGGVEKQILGVAEELYNACAKIFKPESIHIDFKVIRDASVSSHRPLAGTPGLAFDTEIGRFSNGQTPDPKVTSLAQERVAWANEMGNLIFVRNMMEQCPAYQQIVDEAEQLYAAGNDRTAEMMFSINMGALMPLILVPAELFSDIASVVVGNRQDAISWALESAPCTDPKDAQDLRGRDFVLPDGFDVAACMKEVPSSRLYLTYHRAKEVMWRLLEANPKPAARQELMRVFNGALMAELNDTWIPEILDWMSVPAAKLDALNDSLIERILSSLPDSIDADSVNQA